MDGRKPLIAGLVALMLGVVPPVAAQNACRLAYRACPTASDAVASSARKCAVRLSPPAQQLEAGWTAHSVGVGGGQVTVLVKGGIPYTCLLDADGLNGPQRPQPLARGASRGSTSSASCPRGSK